MNKETCGEDRRAAEAKALWGDTPAYKEYEQKTSGMSAAAISSAGEELMRVLAGFAPLRGMPAGDPAVRSQVEALRDCITARFYTCTPEILASLGQMYGEGGEFTQNIDRACGEGTAVFAAEAIAQYCGKKA